MVFQLTFVSGSAFCAQDISVEDMLQEQSQKYYQQGRLQVESGDLDSALVNFQKVIELSPDFVSAYNEAGVILTINGQIEQAKDMYLRAIQTAPDYPESYSNLALLYEEDGDFTNAALCWKKRADLGGSQDEWAQVARKRLQDIAEKHLQTYRKAGGNEYQVNLPGSLPQPAALSGNTKEETSSTKKADSKLSALDYLARAKDFYSRGDYVGALREITMAEYLDPANRQISDFDQQIRRTILK
jgi:tetratricopeptide (TPR) repeat protein